MEAVPEAVSPQSSRNLAQVAHGVLRLMRPRQWPKNAFVLAALVFSGAFLHEGALVRALVATLAFCLLSSAVYALNDLTDRHLDRLHPTKRRRPLASGLLKPWEGATVGGLSAIFGVGLCFALSARLSLVGLGYLALNLVYSFLLKKIPVWDTLGVALGFVARALAGAVAIGVVASPWLLTCTFLVTLYMSLSKRWAEETAVAQRAAEGSVRAGHGYRRTNAAVPVDLLREYMVISMGASLVSYALYCLNSPHGSVELATLPFVVYGLFRFRYLANARLDVGQAPEETLLGDRPFLINAALWAAVALAVAVWP